MAYAETTTVKVEKTEAEIKVLLRKAGADRILSGEEAGGALLSFEMGGRRVTFRLPLPLQDAPEFATDGRGSWRPADKRRAAWEQACRSRWRALFLSIKAKMESVESGIETFEESFLAQIVMPDGSTVADAVRPRIADAYERQAMVPLLPAPAKQRDPE